MSWVSRALAMAGLGAAVLMILGFLVGTFLPVLGSLGTVSLPYIDPLPSGSDFATSSALDIVANRHAATYAFLAGGLGAVIGLVGGIAWQARSKGAFAWEHALVGIAAAMLIFGQIYGLFLSPASRDMGQTVRILFVHVPSAWIALLMFSVAFLGGLGYLFTSRQGFDHLAEASAEVGTLLSAMLLMQGSIWARGTWGAWWEWSPRLTSALVMFLTFLGVLLLRQFVTDPEKRATWGSVATVVAFVNVPIVYMVVRLMPDIHQMQSLPEDVDAPIRFGWRLNVLAFLALATWFTARRWRIARAKALALEPPPLPEAQEAST